MTIQRFNDGRLPGGRRPRLYLARGSDVWKFAGSTIPGVCVVTTAQYEQSGKWSNTEYGLTLAPGVRTISLVSPLHGTWGDDISSWAEVATKLQLPPLVARSVVRAEYPTTATRLDEVEAFAAEVEEV